MTEATTTIGGQEFKNADEAFKHFDSQREDANYVMWTRCAASLVKSACQHKCMRTSIDSMKWVLKYAVAYPLKNMGESLIWGRKQTRYIFEQSEEGQKLHEKALAEEQELPILKKKIKNIKKGLRADVLIEGIERGDTPGKLVAGDDLFLTADGIVQDKGGVQIAAGVLSTAIGIGQKDAINQKFAFPKFLKTRHTPTLGKGLQTWEKNINKRPWRHGRGGSMVVSLLWSIAGAVMGMPGKIRYGIIGFLAKGFCLLDTPKQYFKAKLEKAQSKGEEFTPDTSKKGLEYYTRKNGLKISSTLLMPAFVVRAGTPGSGFWITANVLYGAFLTSKLVANKDLEGKTFEEARDIRPDLKKSSEDLIKQALSKRNVGKEKSEAVIANLQKEGRNSTVIRAFRKELGWKEARAVISQMDEIVKADEQKFAKAA